MGPRTRRSSDREPRNEAENYERKPAPCRCTHLPRAETKNRTASPLKLSRRPNRSPGMLASIAPMIVPHRAMATVKPSEAGVRWYRFTSALVAPAMTAVSKPKSSPPSAATIVLLTSSALRWPLLPLLDALLMGTADDSPINNRHPRGRFAANQSVKK